MDNLIERSNQAHPHELALERGKRIRQVRAVAQLTRKQLSMMAGIGASTLKYWEDGQSIGVTEKGAIKLVAALNAAGIECRASWLLHGYGMRPYRLDAAAIATVHSAIVHVESQPQDDTIRQEVEQFYALNSEAITIFVLDDGMEPFYQQGDVVGGCKRYGRAIDTALNQRCIVEMQDGGIVCRLLKKGDQDGCYHLYCVNIDTQVARPLQYDVAIVSVAPVIWHRSYTSREV